MAFTCGDKSEAKTWKFELMDIIEQGFNIDGTHFGIKYIQSGRKVKLMVFDGPKLNNILAAEPLSIGPHEVLDLSIVKYTDTEYWANNAKSFQLVEI